MHNDYQEYGGFGIPKLREIHIWLKLDLVDFTWTYSLHVLMDLFLDEMTNSRKNWKLKTKNPNIPIAGILSA